MNDGSARVNERGRHGLQNVNYFIGGYCGLYEFSFSTDYWRENEINGKKHSRHAQHIKSNHARTTRSANKTNDGTASERSVRLRSAFTMSVMLLVRMLACYAIAKCIEQARLKTEFVSDTLQLVMLTIYDRRR